jgi:hypothetical protein
MPFTNEVSYFYMQKEGGETEGNDVKLCNTYFIVYSFSTSDTSTLTG